MLKGWNGNGILAERTLAHTPRRSVPPTRLLSRVYVASIRESVCEVNLANERLRTSVMRRIMQKSGAYPGDRRS